MTVTATALRDETGRATSPSWLEKRVGTDFERLPLLADAMTDVARCLADGLASLSAAPGEVTYKGLRTRKLDTQGPGGRGTVFALADAPGWSTPIGLQFDHRFISVVVEACFGGGGDDPQLTNRDSLSPIESSIAEAITEQVAQAITAGFATVLPTEVVLEPIRPKPDLTLLGKPGVPILAATLVLHGIGQPAELEILIPQAALRPFRDRLAGGLDETDPVPDHQWSERLEAEVGRATMQVEASIGLPSMTLGDIARLQVGQVLALPTGARSKVFLGCGADELFRCELGQSAGFYTVRIEDCVGQI